jgi:hypothetical protein
MKSLPLIKAHAVLAEFDELIEDEEGGVREVEDALLRVGVRKERVIYQVKSK